MSSALFGAAPTQARSRNLVEFKAGKMHLKGSMVQPDKRKGLVYVHQSDDSLMHFCWKDRTNGIVEDDLIIFPDDVEIKKVAQCTTGRVYLMKFKSSNKKFFFWMQENETDKDEKLWKKVNDSLNNPPVPGAGSSHPSSSAASSTTASAADRLGNFTSALGDFGVDAHELQNLIGSMSEQQLQMFLGGIMPANSPSSNRSGASSNLTSTQSSRAASAVPAVSATPGATRASGTPAASTTTAPPAATPASSTESAKPTTGAAAAATPTTPASSSTADDTSGKKMQFSEFQSILGNIATTTRSDLDLSEVLSLDVMAPILSNKQIQEKLMQHLPESEILPKTEHELRTTLSTPQFKRAMSSFSHALQTGQLAPLLQQFGLPENVCSAAQQGNLEAFAKAMEDFAKSKQAKQGKDDDAMDTK